MRDSSAVLRKAALGLCVLLCVLIFTILLGACDMPTGQPRQHASPTPLYALAWTPTPGDVQPGSTTTEQVVAPIVTSEPLTTELKATAIASLPATPAPGTSEIYLWGDVELMPLHRGDKGPPLWAVYSVGMGFYDLEAGHFVAIYAHKEGIWQEIGRVVLTDCAEYVGDGSLWQVFLEPSHIWLEMHSGVGAHGGCYDLLSFDGVALHHELAHANANPTAGGVDDLDGDGTQEVILDLTDYYVFCYACGVYLPRFQVLRWEGGQLVEVRLAPMPPTAPNDLQRLNDRAVRLAQAGLWMDAQEVIDEALGVYVEDPRLNSTVDWNRILIELHAEALQIQVQTSVYPLLANVFYGDYEAAVDVMRPYTIEEIWGPDSLLLVGTVAEGAELALSDWISQRTNMALPVQPDLAAAYFLRGWALHVRDPGNPAVLADVERAAELAPDDPLYTASRAYLKVTLPAAIPGEAAIIRCMALGDVSSVELLVSGWSAGGWSLVAGRDPCCGPTRARLL